MYTPFLVYTRFRLALIEAKGASMVCETIETLRLPRERDPVQPELI